MKRIYLIDFDMTISLVDSTEVLLEAHNKDKKKEIRKLFNEKKLSILQYIQNGLESLNITENEYRKTLRENVIIDPTFKMFIDNGIEYKIVSAGTFLNVLEPLISNDINIDKSFIISNDITFEYNESQDEINKIKISHPYLDKEMYYGVDKSEIVKQYKDNGYHVTYIGDGPSDYEAARVSDYVFARENSRLVKYCEDNKIEFSKFNNFLEIN